MTQRGFLRERRLITVDVAQPAQAFTKGTSVVSAQLRLKIVIGRIVYTI